MKTVNSSAVELHFPLQGGTIPGLHSYALYSALSKLIPEAHSAEWLGVHSIKGRRIDGGLIQLGRFAKLRLRMPAEKTPVLCALAGRTLNIDGHQLKCGIPEIHPLKPAQILRSRLVMIKCKDSKGKTAEPVTFLESLKKQISDLGVSADAILEKDLSPQTGEECLARRVIRVKSSMLTGYGVLLTNLNEQDSLKIQEVGLGGKRRMGCGLFDPLEGHN